MTIYPYIIFKLKLFEYFSNLLTKDAQAKVDSDKDDVAISCQYSAVVRVAAVPFKALSMNEHHHGILPQSLLTLTEKDARY